MSSELKNCPQCNKKVSVSDILCINWGYNFSAQLVNNEVLVKSNELLRFDDESFNILDYLELFKNIDEKTDHVIKAVTESDWSNALIFIYKSLENNQSNADLWALKSYILFKLKYFEDAITAVDISLNLDNLKELAWACKAFILNELGEIIAALSCCDEFLSLNHHNADINRFKTYLLDKINNPKIYAFIEPISNPKTHVNIFGLKINSNENFNFKGKFKNHFTEVEDIITITNYDKIENTYLTIEQYNEIIDNIKLTAYIILNKTIKENYIDLNSLSIFEKVLLFVKSFVEVRYKSVGKELGSYSFNKINLDDRIDDSDKITTLIHELSHHLLAEIFEQAVMLILDTDKTYAIESFVSFSFKNNVATLLNEYCAHTVEGRFSPYGHQKYGSFEHALDKFDNVNQDNIISLCKRVGNTFCKDLLKIIEPFIDYNLREEIKQQYKKDSKIPYDANGILLEIKDISTNDELFDLINLILISGFDNLRENPKCVLELKNILELYNSQEDI